MHCAGNQRYITNLHRIKNQYSLGAKPLGPCAVRVLSLWVCGMWKICNLSDLCTKSCYRRLHEQGGAAACCRSDWLFIDLTDCFFKNNIDHYYGSLVYRSKFLFWIQCCFSCQLNARLALFRCSFNFKSTNSLSYSEREVYWSLTSKLKLNYGFHSKTAEMRWVCETSTLDVSKEAHACTYN